MKAIKKLLALSLILVMVLTMMPTAMAAGTCSLTMTGDNDEVEYTIYKMFDVEYSTGGVDAYKYKVTSEWEGFSGYSVGEALVSEFIEYKGSAGDMYVFGKKNPVSAVDGAALAELAKSYVAYNGLTSTIIIKAGQKVENLENGYYLLAASDKSASGVVLLADDSAKNKDKTIKVKTEAEGLPNVEKKVKEDSTDTYGASNSVDVGEIINFMTTIRAASGAKNYVLHDIMDEHMEPIKDSASINRDGTPLVKGVDYNVVYDPTCDDNCTFHIEFTPTLCASLSETAVLTIHYTATLKYTDAPGAPLTSLANHAHTNTSFLTYSDNSRTGETTTETYTYDVVIEKVDNKGNPVVGAGFILRDVANRYYSSDANGMVTWGDKEHAKMISSAMSGDKAIATFMGVDAENFHVEEIVVPDGYVGETDKFVTTKNHGDPNNGKVTIINTLGNALPETGGIGTTVFYAVGGVLVVAALAILIMKKRRVTE